ncbi:MAG: LysE family transporter [Sneathiella sp.]|nr:LysE family transporter [Sneathiella sp.]
MTDLLILFLKSIGIGIAIAAPVGPVGVLCMRRAVSVGRLSAVTTGLGAATADAFYASVTAFGLTAIADLLLQYQTPAALVGGVFLLILAYRIAGSSATAKSLGGNVEVSTRSHLTGYISTFFLTMTNPATILSFAAIFAGIGFLQNLDQEYSAIILVSGVFLGSALWWVILANIATALKKRLGIRFERYVNLASAAVIGIFGVIALASLAIKV